MLEILQYSFFTNALIWWNLIAIIRSIIWVFVIIRREVQISHTISNRVLAGIAIWLFLWINYEISWIIWALIIAIIIFFLNKSKIFTSDSSMELIAQIWCEYQFF